MPIRFHVDEILVENRERRIAELERQLEEMRETVERLSAVFDVDEDNRLTIQASGIEIEADADLTLRAGANLELAAGATLDVTASTQNNNVPIATFSSIVRCDTIIATTVNGTTYTPGAGNVW
jgi:predicted RNase H-like nuclease (RuvC/YqgF family)